MKLEEVVERIRAAVTDFNQSTYPALRAEYTPTPDLLNAAQQLIDRVISESRLAAPGRAERGAAGRGSVATDWGDVTVKTIRVKKPLSSEPVLTLRVEFEGAQPHGRPLRELSRRDQWSSIASCATSGLRWASPL
jgi:hypothetical protein